MDMLLALLRTGEARVVHGNDNTRMYYDEQNDLWAVWHNEYRRKSRCVIETSDLNLACKAFMRVAKLDLLEVTL